MKFLTGVLLAITILVSGCSNNNGSIATVNEPQVQVPTINIVSKVTHLSKNEFERVGTQRIQDPKVDDFRNLILKIEIANGKNVTRKELVVPSTIEFRQILTSDRLWFGNEAYQNNENQELSFAERNYVLYYRELTDDKLKELLSPIEFHISWVNINGDKTSMDYKLVDYLVFE
ncbi:MULTISPECIES: hypothetical protein [Desulfosporosinus]|uniref:Lipoprotein n=1 Tax=Desulfosporosinus lacus DSM 15449 TaxID=1121420 RepID=A0A1M6HAS0_9FIRM|nr:MULTISPECIES: hypothetical protein [Desulfosporosinus]MCO1602572.1 hypothetical protein [Desulfosporosinus nitroreducens]SHJ19184.1 hypothetical protein SAMN02746098_05319 [Desulfosporosinus lacus DSM 15449]